MPEAQGARGRRPYSEGGVGGGSAGGEATLRGARAPGGARVEGAPAAESSPGALLLPRPSLWLGGRLTPAWLGAVLRSGGGDPQRQTSPPVPLAPGG